MLRSVEFDCVTLRERNQRFMSRGGVMAAAARQKAARKSTAELLAKHFGTAPGLWYTPAGAAPSLTDPNPITVRMWRVGPGWLDSDGPDDALKACRDGVADWLGLDDRNAGVEWPRGMQEKTPAVSAQAPCHLCPSPSGTTCNLTYPGPFVNGCHRERKTPWRVRIEVEDRTPGAERRVVLASTTAPKPKAKKRPKATPAGDPGEEVAARLLVRCAFCLAPVGAPCRGIGTAVYGVHVERAQDAGMIGLGGRLTASAPRPASTGVRKMAAKLPRPAPAGQARLPLARCYTLLPWRPREAIHEPRIDGLAPPPSLAYAVPAEHRAMWGRTITLYRQARTAAGVGIITVYALKKDK